MSESADAEVRNAPAVRTFMLNSHWPEFPYPGLRPFSVTRTSDESLIFYGRNAHKDDVLGKLNASHTVFVLGPSGCGKSSLIKAGVIPALEAGLLTHAGHRWRATEMRPGTRPLAALAKAFTSILAEPNESVAAEIGEFLRSQPSGLWLALDSVMASRGRDAPDDCRVLLLLDQFEESFGGQIVDRQEVDQLMRLVTRFFVKPHPNLYLVVTMRSDFIGHCANFPGLAEVINASQYLTPVLNAAELRQTIERPAIEYGGVVQSDLVAQIIADMGSGTAYDADHLPLMQHALLWLWQRASRAAGLEIPPRPDRTSPSDPIRLTLADYTTHGGFKGILDRHADDILATLADGPDGSRRREIAEVMFRRISLRDAQLRYRRSPASAGEICRLASCEQAELNAVTRPFTDASLLELRPMEGTDDNLVDVSHESLIRQWKKLRNWADEEYQSAETYQNLESTAKRWRVGQAALWSMPDLGVARAWRAPERNATWAMRYGDAFDLAMEFLQKSEDGERQREAEKRRSIEAETRAASERKIARWSRRAALVFSILAFAAGVFAYEFYDQRQIAVSRSQLAQSSVEAMTRAMKGFTQQLKFYQDSGTLPADVVRSLLTALAEVSRSTLTALEANPAAKNTESSTELIPWRIQLLLGLSDAFMNLGSTKDAAERAVEAKQLAQYLVGKDPNNAEWEQLLYASCFRIGDAVAEQGDLDLALEQYRLSLKIAEQLAAMDPGKGQWQYDLTFMHNKIGDVLYIQKDVGGALREYYIGLSVAERLADREPNNIDWQRNVAATRHRIGDVLTSQDDLEGAVAQFRATLAIRQQLVDKFPDDDSLKSNLSVTYNRIGDLLKVQGNADGALQEYFAAQSIRQQLAEKDPSNVSWKSHLGFQHVYIGDALQMKGDLAGALAQYREQAIVARNDDAGRISGAEIVNWGVDLAVFE